VHVGIELDEIERMDAQARRECPVQPVEQSGRTHVPDVSLVLELAQNRQQRDDFLLLWTCSRSYSRAHGRELQDLGRVGNASAVWAPNAASGKTAIAAVENGVCVSVDPCYPAPSGVAVRAANACAKYRMDRPAAGCRHPRPAPPSLRAIDPVAACTTAQSWRRWKTLS